LRRRWLVVIAVIVVSLAGWLSAPVWLRALGGFLVETGVPRKADAAFVLAGDAKGQRLMIGCDLLKQGVVPVLLVSGSTKLPWYGLNEADAAIAFGGKNGCDTSRMKPVYVAAFSTVEEARAARPVLEQMGIRDVIVITSNYHTARAARTFRREFGDAVRFTMVAAPDEFFEPNRWWKTREGQKTFFYEFSKTVANWIGL
jgi:hypothetical protein